jgi:hypothetical protein
MNSSYTFTVNIVLFVDTPDNVWQFYKYILQTIKLKSKDDLLVE